MASTSESDDEDDGLQPSPTFVAEASSFQEARTTWKLKTCLSKLKQHRLMLCLHGPEPASSQYPARTRKRGTWRCKQWSREMRTDSIMTVRGLPSTAQLSTSPKVSKRLSPKADYSSTASVTRSGLFVNFVAIKAHISQIFC